MSLLLTFVLFLAAEPQTAVVPPAATTKAEDAIVRLSPDELHRLLENNDAVVVDVRGDVPYSLHHIRGAVSMPLGLIRQRALELPQDKVIVPYCTCKLDASSVTAALEFQNAGFQRVAVLNGGYGAWAAAGLPVYVAPPDPEAGPMPPPGMAYMPEPASAPAAPAGRGRLMPPSQIRCDRNDVTVYSGRVLSYSRVKGKTMLKIRTDSDTTETVTLKHPNSSDPSKWFLLNFEPFKAADWKKIERRQGVLRPGMRVNAWVCKDGKAILDWRPDDQGSAASR